MSTDTDRERDLYRAYERKLLLMLVRKVDAIAEKIGIDRTVSAADYEILPAGFHNLFVPEGTMRQAQDFIIAHALRKHNGNQSAAARELGISIRNIQMVNKRLKFPVLRGGKRIKSLDHKLGDLCRLAAQEEAAVCVSGQERPAIPEM